MRVKRGTTRRKKHKKVLKKAKGYKGRKKSVFKLAKEAVTKAGKHAYKHRRTKKRDFRRLWITKINAAARQHGLKYSRFMHLLSENDIDLDRKMLADMAEHNPEAFAAIVKKVK